VPGEDGTTFHRRVYAFPEDELVLTRSAYVSNRDVDSAKRTEGNVHMHPPRHHPLNAESLV